MDETESAQLKEKAIGEMGAEQAEKDPTVEENSKTFDSEDGKCPSVLKFFNADNLW